MNLGRCHDSCIYAGRRSAKCEAVQLRYRHLYNIKVKIKYGTMQMDSSISDCIPVYLYH